MLSVSRFDLMRLTVGTRLAQPLFEFAGMWQITGPWALRPLGLVVEPSLTLRAWLLIWSKIPAIKPLQWVISISIQTIPDN